MDTSSRNFAKQITLDEYNKQKREYTEKALLELKSQMEEFKMPGSHTAEDDSNDNSEEDFDSSDTAKVNVIIKNYSESDKSVNTGIGLRKRRMATKLSSTSNDTQELSNTIYVQRELDLQEIQKLRNQIKQLKSALAKEESKNHFLKCDLCNAQVDNSNLQKEIKVCETKIIQLENTQNKTWWIIIKLKIYIVFLVMLYIYTLLF